MAKSKLNCSGPKVIQMAEEAWRRTLEINATGAFLCCKYALPLMIAGGRGGRIINMASIAAEKPRPSVAAYAASKAAVVAQEVAEFGITVNAVLPGDVDTALKQWGLQLEALVTQRPYEEVLAAAVARVRWAALPRRRTWRTWSPLSPGRRTTSPAGEN